MKEPSLNKNFYQALISVKDGNFSEALKKIQFIRRNIY